MPKTRTKPEPLRNRKAVTDAICVVMHNRCPSFSIDKLLSHPLQAIRVAVDVAAAAGECTSIQAKRCINALAQLEQQHPVLLNHVERICRIALASRKQGDLKMDKY